MVAEHPNDCKVSLGDCPTCHAYPHGTECPEPTAKAAAVQAAAVVGVVFLLL
jgi:hypothetical protein